MKRIGKFQQGKNVVKLDYEVAGYQGKDKSAGILLSYIVCNSNIGTIFIFESGEVQRADGSFYGICEITDWDFAVLRAACALRTA